MNASFSIPSFPELVIVGFYRFLVVSDEREQLKCEQLIHAPNGSFPVNVEMHIYRKECVDVCSTFLSSFLFLYLKY